MVTKVIPLPFLSYRVNDPHVAAAITCLQHVDLKTGLDDKGELGMNLILEPIREALRYEAFERG